MSYKLTAVGEGRALHVGQVKDPENAVLSFMYDVREPVEFEEIMDETHMDDTTGQKLLKRLIDKGYVKEV